MKCLLVRPPAPLMVARAFLAFLRLEPLDLAIVAGAIEAPHDVRILDLSLARKPERLLQKALREYQPEIVGFGFYTNQAAIATRLAGLVRGLCPQALLVAGGIHATIVPSELAKAGVFDVIVRGEGAAGMREILAALAAGRRPGASERVLVPGDPRFAELAALPPPPPPPLLSIPRPRRELLAGQDYYCLWVGDAGARMPTVFPRVATMRTSMGCPFRCSFCVVHHLFGGRYLPRDPEDVVDEIAALGPDHVYFVDDEMFVDPKRAARIAQLLLERGVKKEYISWARADTIVRNPEVFRLWKQAGMRLVYVGLESMEQAVLDGYSKRLLSETNWRAVEVLRELEIELHGALMVNPDFSDADFDRLEQTIRALAPAELSFTVLSPSPGTPLWEETRARFVCAEPYSFYDCMHTLLPTQLPLKHFYRRFAGLYTLAFRRNPWLVRRIKAPIGDIVRVIGRGLRCDRTLRAIYKEYPPELW